MLALVGRLQARDWVDVLACDIGEAVLTDASTLFTDDATALAEAQAANGLRFHPGRLGGVWPQIREQESAP